MDKETRNKLNQAEKKPDEAKFSIGFAEKVLKIKARMLYRYEESGLIKISRNYRGHRLFSYNDLMYLKSLRKLVTKGYNISTLKDIYFFVRKQNICPETFLRELSEHRLRDTADHKK